MLLSALKNKAIDKRADLTEQISRKNVKRDWQFIRNLHLKIMKELMPRVKGKADGGLVNKIVGEMLS